MVQAPHYMRKKQEEKQSNKKHMKLTQMLFYTLHLMLVNTAVFLPVSQKLKTWLEPLHVRINAAMDFLILH